MTPNQLNTAMKDLDLLQVDIARMFELTPRQVRRWQRGHVKVPAAERILLRLMQWGIIDETVIEDARTKSRR